MSTRAATPKRSASLGRRWRLISRPWVLITLQQRLSAQTWKRWSIKTSRTVRTKNRILDAVGIATENQLFELASKISTPWMQAAVGRAAIVHIAFRRRAKVPA